MKKCINCGFESERLGRCEEGYLVCKKCQKKIGCYYTYCVTGCEYDLLDHGRSLPSCFECNKTIRNFSVIVRDAAGRIFCSKKCYDEYHDDIS